MLTRLALDELCSLYQLLFATTSARLLQVFATVHDRIGHDALLSELRVTRPVLGDYISTYFVRNMRDALTRTVWSGSTPYTLQKEE